MSVRTDALMVVDLDTAFDRLLDVEMWMDVAMVFVGFMGSILFEALANRFANSQVPPELAGAAVLALSAGYGEMMPALGAGLYTVDQLTLRLGVQETVLGMI